MDPRKFLELQEEITRLKAELNSVRSEVYKNNFSSTQVFNKACIFNDRLKVPVFESAPTVGEVGDIICVAAELYICTSVSPVVFTLVGSQS